MLVCFYIRGQEKQNKMQRVRVRVAHLGTPYLNVVITVVVKVENSVDFGVAADPEIFGVLYALRNCLSRVFLHLDVVELSATASETTIAYVRHDTIKRYTATCTFRLN